MRKISMIAAVLPAMALAACSDGSTPSGVVGMKEAEVLAVRGVLVARENCAQCHGADFLGAHSGSYDCPALTVVKSYSFEQFDALLTHGTTIAGEVVDPMVASTQRLGLEDRKALHQYLINLKEPASGVRVIDY